MWYLSTKPIGIDGDIIAYRCGAATDGRYYASLDAEGNELARYKYKADVPEGTEVVLRREPDPLENALHTVKLNLHSLLNSLNAKACRIYLSPEGDSSYRYKLFPEYKGNRKDVEKPHWLSAIRQYLVDHWGAEIWDGLEADDALGITHTSGEISAICSIDKDLLMIPGYHYNFVTGERTVVDDVDAAYNFHKQLLMGDSTDNVAGIYGYGKAKAASSLECDPEDYTDSVVKIYQEHFPEDWESRLNLTAQLLWIQRHRGQSVRLQNKEAEGGISYSWGTVALAERE